MAIDVVTNISLPGYTDKLGTLFVAMKNTLVSSGLWTVTGSGDGLSTFQNSGQTAGVGGSYDVLPENVQGHSYIPPATTWGTGITGSFTNYGAWFQIKEVGTNRTFQIWRSTSTSNVYSTMGCIRWCPDGVAVTGANANTPPAPAGNFANVSGTLSSKSAEYLASLDNTSPLRLDDTRHCIAHVWFSTTARVGGVCPFYMLFVSKTENRLVGGMFYESLLDVQATNTQPYLLSWGSSTGSNSYAHVFGLPGWTNYGPFQNTTYRYTGSPCLPWTFDGSTSAVVSSNGFPGATFPAQREGEWRTQYGRARTATAYLGRSEHIMANVLPRDYPTTFGLSTTTPLIAVGHLILPWKQNVQPGWGP